MLNLGGLLGWLKTKRVPVADVRVGDIIVHDISSCYPFRVAHIVNATVAEGLIWFYDAQDNSYGEQPEGFTEIFPLEWQHEEQMG